eukprot:72145_1
MTLGFVTIVTCIFIIYAEKCYETIGKHELGFWIWAWPEQDYVDATFIGLDIMKRWQRYYDALKIVNGDWSPAKYVGAENDKIHKFMYTDPDGGIITFEFPYKEGGNNPCEQLATHIKKHKNAVIPIIQLEAKMTHPAIYYKYVQAYRARENQPILIRPIQKMDNEILFVGEDDATLPFKLRAKIYQILNHWSTRSKLNSMIEHYQHQNVFTTIKILDEDYNGNKKHDELLKKKYMTKILGHKGIVIFAYYQYETKISAELATDKKTYDTQLDNIWKHSQLLIDSIDNKKKEFADAINGKKYKYTMPPCYRCDSDDEETHLLLQGKAEYKRYVGNEYPLTGKVFDIYSYLGYQFEPPFEAKWVGKMPKESNALGYFDGPGNNKLTIVQSQHSRDDADGMRIELELGYHGKRTTADKMAKQKKIDPTKFVKYDYVLLEYDLHRLRYDLKDNFEEEHTNDMLSALVSALFLDTTKIILVDNPYTVYLKNLFLLGHVTSGDESLFVQHPDALQEINVIIRNAVMANAINAIIAKDKLKNKKFLIAVGLEHCR